MQRLLQCLFPSFYCFLHRHPGRHSFSNQQSIISSVSARLRQAVTDNGFAFISYWLNSWEEWARDGHGSTEFDIDLNWLLITVNGQMESLFL